LKDEKIFGIEDGEKTFGIVFNDPKHLSEFIKIMENQGHLFKSLITSD